MLLWAAENGMSDAKPETLPAACGTGGFTKAAERLSCTQSAVGHSIRRLEQEGVYLFLRGEGGIKPTTEPKKEQPILWPLDSDTRNLFLFRLESSNRSIRDFKVILEDDNVAAIKNLTRT